MGKLSKREKDPNLKFMDKTDSKYGRNLQKVKDMVDGTYGRKVLVGDHSVGRNDEVRKVGETWTDSDGYKWVQHQGYREKKSVLPAKGIAERCSECEKYIIDNRDKKMHSSFKKCFYCQLDFEAELQLYPIKYWAWKRLRALQVWKSIDAEALQWFEEKEKIDSKPIYDKTVAKCIS